MDDVSLNQIIVMLSVRGACYIVMTSDKARASYVYARNPSRIIILFFLLLLYNSNIIFKKKLNQLAIITNLHLQNKLMHLIQTVMIQMLKLIGGASSGLH